MTRRLSLLLSHLVLVLLACTGGTLVTTPLRWTSGFEIRFLSYAYADGWGFVYRSEHTLLQVLLYIAAYGTGLFVFRGLTRPAWLATVATLVCGIGLASFTFELTHWFIDHHLTVIASFPVVLIGIAVWTLVREAPRRAGIAATAAV